MKRSYRVDIVDKDGGLILRFAGDVIEKEQTSGHVSGPVHEVLFVSNPRFTITNKFKAKRKKIS